MFLDIELPNDLHRYPLWPETIATMPINYHLLGSLDDIHEQLNKAGFYVMYGIEANLSALTPAEAKTNLEGTSLHEHWARANREQFTRDFDKAKDRPFSRERFGEIFVRLQECATRKQAQQLRRPNRDTYMWLERWKQTQWFYDRATAPFGKPDIMAHARKNFVLAALHLLPRELGGLESLIDMRFGDAHGEKGWWDGTNTIEIRTMPQRGHENAIAGAHEVFWKVKNAFENLDYVLASTMAHAQVHFSVWRAKDNVNLFALKDQDSMVLQAKLAESLRRRLAMTDLEFPSARTSGSLRSGSGIVGSSRGSVIRECGDHMELRLAPGGVTHIARDIYIIASAMRDILAYTPSNDHAPPEVKAKLEKVNSWLNNNIVPQLAHAKPVEIVTKMEVKSGPTRMASLLRSCLEGAVLGDDGTITLPTPVITWNGPLLNEALSKADVGLFTADVKGKNKDLNDDRVWQALFTNLKIRKDGTIDASALNSKLAGHFASLRVTGTHKAIHGGNIENMTGDDQTYTHRVAMKWMARGLGFFGPPPTSDEIAIGKFLSDSALKFDPEQAVKTLLTGRRESIGSMLMTSRPYRETVDNAVEIMMWRTLGDWLGYKRRYPEALAEFVDCFPESDIVSYMMHMRKTLLAAVPEAMRVQAPLGQDYFQEMERVLREPQRLYAPKILNFVLRSAGYNSQFVFNKVALDLTKPKVLAEGMDMINQMTSAAAASLVRIAAADQNDEAGVATFLQTMVDKVDIMVPDGNPDIQVENADSAAAQLYIASQSEVRRAIIEEATALLTDAEPVLKLRSDALAKLNHA